MTQSWTAHDHGFDEAGFDQMRRLLRGHRRKTQEQHVPLAEVLGHIPYTGGQVLLPEGRYYVYSVLALHTPDLHLEGEGNHTEIVCVRGGYLRWTGARGRLRNLLLRGEVTAGSPRTGLADFLLHVTGDHWRGRDLRLTTCRGAVRLGGSHEALLDTEIADETERAVYADGAYHYLCGINAEASASANEIDSTGAQARVAHCICLGGNINVVGAGSNAHGNQV